MSEDKKKKLYILIILVFIGTVIAHAVYVHYKDRMEIVSIISEWNKYGKPVDVFVLEKSNMVFYTTLSGTVNNSKISAFVPAGIKNRLQNGQKFFTEHYGTRVNGIVENISEYGDKQSGLYSIELRITDKIKIPKGSILTANIQSKIIPDLLCVPSESVIRAGDRTYAWVIEEDNRAVKKEVKLGLTNGEEYQIISGLKNGERVVTSGKDFLVDGDLIREYRSKK